VGHLAEVIATATRNSHWEIRIDEGAPRGVNPVPEKVPSRRATTG
jgi:hypothetical protein